VSHLLRWVNAAARFGARLAASDERYARQGTDRSRWRASTY